MYRCIKVVRFVCDVKKKLNFVRTKNEFCFYFCIVRGTYMCSFVFTCGHPAISCHKFGGPAKLDWEGPSSYSELIFFGSTLICKFGEITKLVKLSYLIGLRKTDPLK